MFGRNYRNTVESPGENRLKQFLLELIHSFTRARGNSVAWQSETLSSQTRLTGENVCLEGTTESSVFQKV